MGRQALGKGFDALIPKSVKDRIPLDRIYHSPLQPRMEIDKGDLKGLVESIKQRGVLQPVLVRHVGERYELVYGHRRFEAAKRANLYDIPAVIRRLSDSEVLEIAVIENVQREDLNPIEEANAYYKLNTEFNLTQEEIAEKVGKARTTIANKMRLMNLPEEVKDALRNNSITEGHARALLTLGDKKKILKEFRNIINKKTTVRQVERITRKKQLPLPYQELKDELIHFLNTGVEVKIGRKKSKLIIEFYSEDDLTRIYNIITGYEDRVG